MSPLGFVILGTEAGVRASENDQFASELLYQLLWACMPAIIVNFYEQR